MRGERSALLVHELDETGPEHVGLLSWDDTVDQTPPV